MPFSQEKLDEVKTGIEHALSSEALNEWERKFLLDMRDKLQRYGRKTSLSEKQYRKLMQLGGNGTSTSRTTQDAPVKRPQLRIVPSITKRASVRPRPPRRQRQPGSNRGVTLSLGLSFLLLIGLMTAKQDWLLTPPTEVNGDLTSLSASNISVVDGDTIGVSGQGNRVRLVGFNTPETFDPVCDAGLTLGKQATNRLKDLIRTASLIELEIVSCACPIGTQGTRECNYGRACGKLYTDGKNVANVLISEGLAARFVCGRTSCPPTPRPWCS